MSLIKYVVKHTDLVEYDGHASAFQEVVYIARGADARIARLESLLHRVIDWKPALPAEAGLQDEIGKALGL
jgi:hypothetical protein